ncbi:hypothetical protein [Bartonella florencae]|uniref:hypothetical protein n=1 Tax=Bartonella florencae TaxID=928210 RepID=UPI0002F02355|nr:hypothetical protein [Bartonella florencae]
MEDLITRQEIEEEVEEISSEPEREILQRIYRKRHKVLIYSIFLFLYTIRRWVKRILEIIARISFVLLIANTLAYWLLSYEAEAVQFRAAFIITTIMLMILICSAVALSWFYKVLLRRLAPPDIRLMFFD